MGVFLLIIFLLIAATVYLLTTGFFALFGRTRIRLTPAPGNKQVLLRTKRGVIPLALIKNVSYRINKPFFRSAYFRNIQYQAEFIGLRFGALELFFIKEACLIIAVACAAPFLPFPQAFIAGIAGFVLPDFYLSGKIRAKKDAIIRYFPETVDLLDLCIGAGLDFLSAIQWVTQKSQANPFIGQLELVMKEIQVGKSRTEALKAMAKRLNIPDINSFSRTIVQAERMGASVEEALRNLSEDTRANRFERGERYAIKASLKILIPLLLFILPVIMIVVAGPIIIQFSTGGLMPGGAGF